MITESLMANGGFTVSLIPETPWRVRKLFNEFGYVVVLRGEQLDAGVTAADLRTLARYSGVVDRVTGDMTVLEGRGIGALLGDGWRGPRDSGEPTDATNFDRLSYSNASPDTIDSLFTTRSAAQGGWEPIPDTGTGRNGIVADTLSTSTLVPNASFELMRAQYGFNYPTARELIDIFASQVSPATSMEWRVKPDWTFDMDLPANLFADGDVLFSEQVAYAKGSYADHSKVVQGIPVARAEVVSQDFERMVSKWWSIGPSDLAASPGWRHGTGFGTRGTLYDIRGAALDLVGMTILATEETSATDLVAVSGDLVDLWQDPRREIAIEVEAVDVRRFCEPGDYVWMFDPLRGVVDDALVIMGGAAVTPAKLRVWSMDSPIVKGMDVYFVSGEDSGTGADRVTKLTPYVQWEQARTVVTLGNRPTTLA